MGQLKPQKGKKIKGILIDFDGVISKNSVTLILDFIHDYINQFIYIPHDVLKNYFKSVICFPTGPAIDLLFSSLGILDKIHDFVKKYHLLTEYKGKSMEIDAGFAGFIDFCKTYNIEYRLLSLAGKSDLRIGKIKSYICDSNIIQLSNRSKADPNTFKDLGEMNHINLREWLYLDDSPMALNSASIAGLNTVVMINKLFTAKDRRLYKESIHHQITGFSDLKRIIKIGT
jgi:hypothetical protein